MGAKIITYNFGGRQAAWPKPLQSVGALGRQNFITKFWAGSIGENPSRTLWGCKVRVRFGVHNTPIRSATNGKDKNLALYSGMMTGL